MEEGPAKWNFEGWPGHTVKKMMEYDVMGSPRRGGISGYAAGTAGGCPACLGDGGRVDVGDGWMVTPAPCRTAASLPFMAGLKRLLNTREDALPALLSTGLSETAAQQGSQ